MAFMGIFMMYMVVILAVLGFCSSVGIVLLVLSYILKRRYVKNPEGKKKLYLIPRIVGWLFMIPVIATGGLVLYAVVSTNIEKNGSLSRQVMEGRYEAAERLLKRGVSPDCTMDSNEAATDGEESLLNVLCRKGFVDKYGSPIHTDNTEADELKMIQLLLDYGADIEHIHYMHPEDYGWHTYEDEESYYRYSDACGSTPLLDATWANRPDIVALLLENGADVQAEDFSGYNAINLVADNHGDEAVELLQFLLEHKCEASHVTKYQQSSSFLATRHNRDDNKKIVQMLSY